MRELNNTSSSLLTRLAFVPKSEFSASRANSATLIKFYRLLDTAIALGVLFGVLMAINIHRMPNGFEEFFAIRVTVKNLVMLGIFSIAWPLIFFIFGLYDPQRVSTRRDELIRIINACMVGSAFTLLFALTSISGYFRFRAVIYFWLGVTVLTVLVRHSIYTLVTSSTSHQRRTRNAIIVGSGPRALKLYQEICDNPHIKKPYELLGFVDSPHDTALEETRGRILGTLEQLENILMTHVVDEVFIALPIKSCYAEIQTTIRICEEVGVESKYLSDVFQFSLAKPRYEQTQQLSMVTMKVVHDDQRLVLKRVIDVVGALFGLVVFMPVILLAAIAIKLISKGPVFFSQERLGLNKRKFWMYKLRTMVIDAEALQSSLEQMNEAAGPVFKIKNDPRVTPVGRFLRKTSIDELPQLFNVLRGDMSLVGPRPLPTRDFDRFSEATLMRRFSVKPGLTCLWQISGRSDVSFDRWLEMDLKYIDEWSLGLDLEIIAKTFPAILKGTGAA